MLHRNSGVVACSQARRTLASWNAKEAPCRHLPVARRFCRGGRSAASRRVVELTEEEMKTNPTDQDDPT
eukprot:CAMPEP_0177229028 /NCGR_PEP_ID=MMETSP0367-20130122/41472_1 /TAXON_ID=447022 ORGANISM="Scrippsiella hangoei-like, Strain SHHI-4" /NCGR_SAMPLE_ID=MMETSP0367 /ASSEMBLY_ACC=CAM_ASM_000362 /LENGTH=68 /DNA_ID=CAMNT_0018679383 /DNA_START=326 /DNA_END=528 /DNA_ORIENTATION=-